METTGAQILVESLVAAGVRHLFTLSGNQILSVFDATIGRDIELIHTRHEAAAVHMADGWGRLTEEPGVALVTAGPGHCNTPSALYVALMAESPVVLLSGHSPHAQIGRGAFQEMDQIAVVRPVTKAARLVEDAESLGAEIAGALALCRAGRPGPVHLSLPDDVTKATLPSAPDIAGLATEEAEAAELPPPERLGEILALLQKAERPLILAGPAMARPQRWAAVARLAQATGIPALPMESPRGVNDPWLHGAAGCLAAADLVLLLGKKLDFALRFARSPFFADDCRFVQIDASADGLDHDERVIRGLCADPFQAAQWLSSAAADQRPAPGAWRQEVESERHATPAEWKSLCGSSAQPMHPLRVCAALQPFLDDGAVLVSDGGEFGQWAQAGLEARCRLINGPSGAIGSSLPMALAAKLAYPERQVFAVLGDGTFGFHALEFDTALRYDLPVIAVVGNDARWNAEHQLQLQHYGADRLVGCDLLPSRYDSVVEALGGHGEFVERPEELAPALERAVESRLPSCVNVAIEGAAAPTFL